MSQFFDFNPVTGVTERFAYEEDVAGDKVRIYQEQDVEPLLEHAKEVRNSGAADKGIKQSWWHYMSIPPVWQLHILKTHGIDPHNKHQRKELFDCVNTHYPHLKMTDKTHGSKKLASSRTKASSTPRGKSPTIILAK